VDRTKLKQVGWRSVLFLCAWSDTAAAQVRALSTPEEPLSQALKDIGRQTGLSILFIPASVQGLRVHALSGRMTAQQALDELLHDTGLVAVPDGRGFLIEQGAPPASGTPVPEPREPKSRAPVIRHVPEVSTLPVEQVIVSPTRILSTGFSAPTPTTVVTAAYVEAQAKPNIFETLTDLPQLQGSSGVIYNTNATSNGLLGLSALGLRGLSPLRTLVLLDGQRVVSSHFSGVVDISQMPQLLLQRVDIVTGGASASWGSDAVAGVVNFITDKQFEGFKLNVMSGLSTYGDMGTANFQAAAGAVFAGGRGHYEVAGEYSYNDGLLPRLPVQGSFGPQPQNLGGRPLSRLSGTADYGVGKAPAGQPRFVYAPLIQGTGGAGYGLITSGPQAYTGFDTNGRPYRFSLAGNCFLNAAGTLQNSVPSGNGGTCLGSPTNPGESTNSFISGVRLPITRGNLYGRLSYDLAPETEIYATLLYGVARTQNTPGGGGNGKAITLKCDNAYLQQTGLYPSPAGCDAANPGGLSFGSTWANVPVDQQVFFMRSTRRYTVGGEGRLALPGGSWSWSSYFQHGESGSGAHIENMILSNAPVDLAASAAAGRVITNANLSRFNLASDAVFNSAGQIVCRNTLAQSFGCVPFNPFGAGPISPGSQAYIMNQNGPGGTTTGPTAVETVRQEAFSFSINGAPLNNWAGAISVAAGYEYREEHYSQRADPYGAGISASTPATVNEPCTDPFIDCGQTSLGGLGAYSAGNYHNGRGTYHVNEAFVDLGIPILDDGFWGKMDLELAGRHARYSTAGDANTWKAGFTWNTPIPGVRLRALQSRDIRAPNLSELFAPVTGLNVSFTNRVTGQIGQNQVQSNEGNTLLKPEKSQTTEAGLVWQPDFVPGFQMSVDYWRIGIKGFVNALSVQQVEDQCILQGDPRFCGQDAITTANGVNQSQADPGGPAGPGFVGTVPNQITNIHAKPFNAASAVTDGLDLEASYQFELEQEAIPGSVNLRALASHVSKYIFDTGIAGTQRNVELAGWLTNVNQGQTYSQSGGTVMTWKMEGVESYQNDVWGFSLTERWYAGGTFMNKNTIVCAPGTCPFDTVQSPTINFDKVDAVLYLDIGLNWNVSDQTRLYAKVDNVTNIMPPDVGAQTAANSIYDVVGRMYRIGVRFNN
jgi:iron complex outermembrane recepter protein